MEIIKGKLPHPVKCVMYGPEGIGKTTFAAKWPAPVFIDLESGTGRLNVDRITVMAFPELDQIMTNLASDRQGYQTLVFDTADWLDMIMQRQVCNAAGKNGIEDFGYGKGFVYLSEKWKEFLDRLTRFSGKTGMHIVFLAHATLRKFEQPDEAGAYDRWELKCAKTVSPLLKEWADLLLFANYKTLVVSDENGRKKATGAQRKLYTNHHACWDAKNRFDLPGELALEIDRLPSELAEVIQANSVNTVQMEPEQSQTPPVDRPTPEAPLTDPVKVHLLEELENLLVLSGISVEQLQAEVARNGVATIDMTPAQYNVQTLKRLTANWDVIRTNIQK